MQRFFTDELLQEYKRIGPMPYTLMNHKQFYTWWKDDQPPAHPH